MGNFFVFVSVYSPCDSAKKDTGFVELSLSTRICTDMQWSQYLCSVYILAYCSPGEQSHFWNNKHAEILSDV